MIPAANALFASRTEVGGNEPREGVALLRPGLPVGGDEEGGLQPSFFLRGKERASGHAIGRGQHLDARERASLEVRLNRVGLPTIVGGINPSIIGPSTLVDAFSNGPTVVFVDAADLVEIHSFVGDVDHEFPVGTVCHLRNKSRITQVRIGTDFVIGSEKGSFASMNDML